LVGSQPARSRPVVLARPPAAFLPLPPLSPRFPRFLRRLVFFSWQFAARAIAAGSWGQQLQARLLFEDRPRPPPPGPSPRAPWSGDPSGRGSVSPPDNSYCSTATLSNMGWLTKFFRGSTHNISEGQYHSRPAEETAWNEPSSSPVVTVRTVCNTFTTFTTLCKNPPFMPSVLPNLVQDKRRSFYLSSVGIGDAFGISPKRACPVPVIIEKRSYYIQCIEFCTSVT